MKVAYNKCDAQETAATKQERARQNGDDRIRKPNEGTLCMMRVLVVDDEVCLAGMSASVLTVAGDDLALVDDGEECSGRSGKNFISIYLL